MSGKNSVIAARNVQIHAAIVSRLLHHTRKRAAAGHEAKHKILAHNNGTTKGVMTIKANVSKPASANHGTRFLFTRFLFNRFLFNSFLLG